MNMSREKCVPVLWLFSLCLKWWVQLDSTYYIYYIGLCGKEGYVGGGYKVHPFFPLKCLMFDLEQLRPIPHSLYNQR